MNHCKPHGVFTLSSLSRSLSLTLLEGMYLDLGTGRKESNEEKRLITEVSERINPIENAAGKKAALGFGESFLGGSIGLDSFCSSLQGKMTADPISWR